MFRKLVPVVALFVLCLSPYALAADDEAIDTSIRQNFLSARALGMGNAFIALADDYNALLINPAGLARLETWQINMSFEGAFGTDFQSFVGSLEAKSDEGTSQITSFLRDFNGSKFGARFVPASGFLVRPNMGVALVPLDVSANFAVNGQGQDTALPPEVEAIIYADTTAAMGIARDVSIGNGRFSWGVTGKLIHRVHMSKSFLPIDLVQSDTELFSAEDANEGLTLDADVGVLWTPKLPHYEWWRVFRLAKPTFGAVVRNALDLGFDTNLHTVSENSGKPVRLYRTLDLGSRWEYPKFWVFRSRGLMDIRDIGHPNWNFYKGIHIGWELAWRMYDWWKGYYRFGINQGYLTFGASARLGIWNLDFATWGEEVGTYSNRVENRRIMMKFNIEI